MRKFSLIVGVMMISLLALATVAIAADPTVGTWKLNIAKSKLGPNTTVKELFIVTQEVGTDFETIFKGTAANGSPFSFKSTSPQQGGVLKSEQAPTEGNFVVITVVGPGDLYGTSIQNGKQVEVTHTVVSKDGKTINRTSKAIDAQGNLNETLMVFDKQ
jgi:hypothetical protein